MSEDDRRNRSLCCRFNVVMVSAGTLSGEPVAALLTSVPDNWWNPGSIGIPMILIFSIAIIPGWITEQDPWQKVWAATDERCARNGMFLGTFLVAVVFAGCALLALGLNTIYPEIAGAGFPMGMARAEPALLTFIMDHNFSGFTLALCAVGLATAAMSCTDTFATSGASCISRDIFQRYLHPGATMKQMLAVNRISVIIIIALATLGSFFINSIIDAIHIATFIASAAYFFALMGGLYWRRATGQGALASLATGFTLQSVLVIMDLAKTPPMAPPFLESIHPVLMGHGVLSNFLHAYGPDEAEQLLQRAVSMLKPGGMVVIHDYFPDRTGRSPQKGALYDLAMMLNTFNGACHTTATIGAWLEQKEPWARFQGLRQRSTRRSGPSYTHRQSLHSPG